MEVFAFEEKFYCAFEVLRGFFSMAEILTNQSLVTISSQPIRISQEKSKQNFHVWLLTALSAQFSFDFYKK